VEVENCSKGLIQVREYNFLRPTLGCDSFVALNKNSHFGSVFGTEFSSTYKFMTLLRACGLHLNFTDEHMSMRPFICSTILACIFLLLRAVTCAADPVPVHHLEGVTFGFLKLRNVDGKIIADGYLKQVATPASKVITDDLQFHFTDGSVYRETTKFTQRGTFRLISDHLVQKGPSFKQESESWIDAASGKVTVRTVENGKDKRTTKQMSLPPDVSNGLLFTLVKNMDPAAETTVSMVAPTDKPRIVKLRFTPAAEKEVKFGLFTFKAQHYVMKVKIEGAAGKIAPLVGKQPPDSHFWTIKSESPTFVEFEGPLSAEGPVWRIEFAAPELGGPEPKADTNSAKAK
jgi:hypothetical protein